MVKEENKYAMIEDSDDTQSLSIQKLSFWDIFIILILMCNNITSKNLAFLPAFSSPGEEAFSNFEIDLGLTKTQYGILSGVTFTLISGIFALVNGIIVDRYNRKWILIISGIIWSLMVVVQSFSTNFITILIPRLVLEVATTATGPAGISIISDTF